MDEPYRIEVLHIVNPHVIFIESRAQRNVPVIEQVGIYGVLPVNKTIDIDGDILVERCENWPIAANTILREFVAGDNDRLYFVPMHVDERSTIFDENIYKFGNIIKQSKKNISIASNLIDNAVAVEDECTFLRKLSNGSLKLKLNTTRTEEVLNFIKKYYKQRKVNHNWQETLKKQTYFHQETKKITAALTAENLKLLESSSPIRDIRQAIEMKEKALELCKDADLVSVGCGTRRRSRPSSATLSKSNDDDRNSPKNILSDVKLFLDKHGHKKETPYRKKSSLKQDVNKDAPASYQMIDNLVNSDDEWDDISENYISESKHEPESTDRNENYLQEYVDQDLKPTHNIPTQRTISGRANDTQDQSKQKLNFNEESNNSEFCYGANDKTSVAEILGKSQKQKVNINKYQDKKAHHTKKNSPIKAKERRLVYCPDMEMSTDNVKKLVAITVSEDADANYTNTMEVPPDLNQSNIQKMECNDICKKKDGMETCEITGKSNVGIHSDICPNTHKTIKSNTGNSGGRLDILYLQKKLQALKQSQKTEANNNVSSNSDVSSDQIDYSLRTNEDNMPITDEPLCVAKSKNVEEKIYNDTDEINVTLQSNIKSGSAKSDRKLSIAILKRRLQISSDQQNRKDTSCSSNSDTSVKDTSSSTEESKFEPDLSKVDPSVTKAESTMTKVDLTLPKPNLAQDLHPKFDATLILPENVNKVQRNVNPFKNLDGNKSVFVEKLVSPTLMVHTKNDNLILPKCELRDVPFKADIRMMLKSVHIHRPKRLQTVTWSYILRGHSMFIIGPTGNGKTLGYVPAICNLVSDARTQYEGVGPICIVVCATALSVSEVENLCKRFLSAEKKIVTFYPGIDPAIMATDLLNGCHLLICTAPALVTLLETDFGVDLRRLGILVLDDCERLSQVYGTELHKITQNVNLMLKNRADKAMKVQYIIASRQWCDFMTPLAKKAPDTVIAIGASQECVLYSKTHTSVNIVNSDEKKMNSVFEFLEQNDLAKRTVIVCREDKEVDHLAATLKDMRYTVFSCNNSMTLHDLYKLSDAWNSYREPISGPILVCCDGNLTHLNITNANYLIHYSLPPLFSMFCKRFFVLNENYSSIFVPEKLDAKIMILMDKTNVEQLPKILHFVKRCTNEDLPNLDDVLQEVMKGKDLKKAEILTPICNIMLMLGKCVDIWNCADRHTVFEEFDQPKDWMPKNGVITFKITHFDSAVTYSARVLSKTTRTDTVKFPNNFNTLALKMGMHYSKEVNRKLHGVPKVGDICAVASQQSLFERCRIMKIIPGDRKNTCHVLINLIDKEQMIIVSDVDLYYLPEDLKAIETYVIKVRLANIQPKDKDVTFSIKAKEHVQRITELDRDSGLYMRGKVLMTLGNCIFVDTAEACIDLSSMGETVVKRDFKKELLGLHAEPNPQHIDKIKKLVGIVDKNYIDEPTVAPIDKKCPKWAHLDKDDFSTVIFAALIDANTIFLRHLKFLKVIESLQKDIQAYVETAPKIDPGEIYVGNIVLAEVPDDKNYERVRIDEVIDDKKVNCFFVDNGDWRQVAFDNLKPITETLLHRIPFQAIECRLVGIKPPGNADDWPEFSTCWLDENCFEDKEGRRKQLFVKYFTKEPAAVTGGHKYGVVVIDTSSDQDVVINKMMIELNLAKEIEAEKNYIDAPFDMSSLKSTESSSDDDFNETNNYVTEKEMSTVKDLVPMQSKETFENNTTNNKPLNILFGKPIRSVPLVNSDNESDVSDKWDVNVDKDMLGMFGQPSKSTIAQQKFTTNEENTTLRNTTANKFDDVNTIASIKLGRDVVKNEINNLTDKNVSSGSTVSESNSSFLRTNNDVNSIKTPSKSPSLDSDDEIEDGKNKALDNFVNKMFKNNNAKSTLAEKTNSEKDSRNDTLDSDDLSSVAIDVQTNEVQIMNRKAIDLLRKPKLVWRQDKNTVSLKINLIGVEDYVIEFKDRHIKFETWHNDTQYGFEFELYGAILPHMCLHSNKGQYIQVSIVKMLERNWLNLTKDFSTKKWIVYDVDAIEFSSEDDDDDQNDEARKVIKYNHDKVDSASEDDDLEDDLNFTYKRH